MRIASKRRNGGRDGGDGCNNGNDSEECKAKVRSVVRGVNLGNRGNEMD